MRLGEMRVETVEGTRSIALELCREFDDKFLETISSGEVLGVKLVFLGHYILAVDCFVNY